MYALICPPQFCGRRSEEISKMAGGVTSKVFDGYLQTKWWFCNLKKNRKLCCSHTSSFVLLEMTLSQYPIMLRMAAK